VSKCAPQEAFRDLERTFRNWREGRAKRPRFKRKKALHDNTARLTGAIRVFSLTCAVERPDPPPRPVQGPPEVVGRDLGLEAFAVLSGGTRTLARATVHRTVAPLKAGPYTSQAALTAALQKAKGVKEPRPGGPAPGPAALADKEHPAGFSP